MAFEDDVWEAIRPPFRPKYKPDSNIHFVEGFGRGGGFDAHGLSADSARAHLARLVRRTPEVLVKVTGRPKGRGHTIGHLAYISRHGKLGVETRDGELLTSKEEIAERASEWSDDAAWRKMASVSCVSMVFSMPAGTNPESVLGAVRSLAYRELGDNHDYVMALHTDTDRPHVHLAVQAQGDDRRRFNPGREELHRFREQFAIELRKRGIEASATPRRARGVGRAGSSMALRQIRDRHAIGSGVPARDDVRAAQHSVAVIRGQASHPVFVAKAKERWASISEAYRRAVAALERSEATNDRDLARSLEAFVTGRPAPEMMPEILVRAYERQMAEIGEGANLGIDVDMNGKGREVSDPPKTPPTRGR